MAEPVLPWISVGAVLSIVLALYFGIFASPADYQQGETVRIMYVHVPAAWMALFTYTIMALASGAFLIWKHPLADLSAQAAAPIGAAFTAIALITGSLWGQPMWGTWWVWDARLTSVLILFFLYLGYIALVNGFDDPERGSKMGAILALVGFVNVPIIKFSVDWWNTLHQTASVNVLSNTSIHISMLIPLGIMTAAFALFSLLIFLMKYNTELIKIKNKGLDRL
jgi:heme exporter protein C